LISKPSFYVTVAKVKLIGYHIFFRSQPLRTQDRPPNPSPAQFRDPKEHSRRDGLTPIPNLEGRISDRVLCQIWIGSETEVDIASALRLRKLLNHLL